MTGSSIANANAIAITTVQTVAVHTHIGTPTTSTTVGSIVSIHGRMDWIGIISIDQTLSNSMSVIIVLE